MVTYLKQINEDNKVNVSFVFGQAKMASLRATTIPRLEPCGAVLSSQVVKKLLEEFSIPVHEVVFYTDSKVVLGYIQNESKRFYVYVANRVQLIRTVSDPTQWRYVDTSSNPADLATRGSSVVKLKDSIWLSGPAFLWEHNPPKQTSAEMFSVDLVDPEVSVNTCCTGVHDATGLPVSRSSPLYVGL